MILKSNFKSFVNSLSNKHKLIAFNSNKEFIYVNLSSYGDIIEFKPTNDNNGAYQEEIQSEEWDGNTYLIMTNDIVNIIKNDVTVIDVYKTYNKEYDDIFELTINGDDTIIFNDIASVNSHIKKLVNNSNSKLFKISYDI